MNELFIYYRLALANAAAGRAMVESFQARLRARHPGLTTRLMRRPEHEDGLQTWMEIYSFEPSPTARGVTPELAAEIDAEAQDLSPFIIGARHSEVFIPCVS